MVSMKQAYFPSDAVLEHWLHCGPCGLRLIAMYELFIRSIPKDQRKPSFSAWLKSRGASGAAR